MSVQKEPDNIYVNIFIDHSGKTTEPEIAEYNVTKTSPILGKASDFYCSVVRFDIPLNALPLFIMTVIPNQSNPNLTPFITGIRYNGVNKSQNLIYTPLTFSPPPVQNQPIQIITDYYFVYFYSTMLEMVNTALNLAYIAQGFDTIFGATVIPPYFFYDSNVQLIKLVIPSFFTKVTAPLTSIPTIYFNALLYEYFESFPVDTLSFVDPDGRDYELILTNAKNIQAYEKFKTIYPPYSGTAPALQYIDPSYYVIAQEYNTTIYWISLRKLLLTTNTIPIVNEYVSNYNGNNGSNNPSLPILTDFVPGIEFGSQSRSIAYYVPQSQYRLIDLLDDGPLNRIDIKVYWEDKSGNIFPLYISYFQEINIKLGFFKKSLYKPTGLLKM
jgi:hypothetical protein